MKCVGIDIGGFSIKTAEIDVSSKSYSITGYDEYPLSLDLQKDRTIEFIEIFRSIAAKYDPTQTRFIVGLPQDQASIRHKAFPFKERQKILKSLAFELEDEIPFNLDDAVFDTKVIQYNGNTSETLAIAAPKDDVESLLQKCRDAGIDPDIISVEGLALGNAFEKWWLAPPQMPEATNTYLQDGIMPPPEPARVVLNIGHRRTLLLVYRDTALIASRSIQWGGAEIAENLQRAFSLPHHEAVKVLQTKSFILMNSAGASRDQITLSTAVSSAVDNLVRELKLSLLELKTEHNLNYGSLDLLGGASLIQNLAPYLTQSIEIPANVSKHMQNYRGVRVNLSPSQEAASAVAIGLAIEGMKKPRNPAINLRKGEFAKQNQTLQIFWDRWKYAAQIGATAFVIFCIYAFARDMVTTELALKSEDALATQAQRAAGLKRAQATVVGVERYINKQKTALRSRESLKKLDGYVSAMDILQQLSDRLPAGEKRGNAEVKLDIAKIIINNDDLRIEGKVGSPAHVAEIEKALSELAQGKSLKKVPVTVPAQGAGAAFAFTMKINRLN